MLRKLDAKKEELGLVCALSPTPTVAYIVCCPSLHWGEKSMAFDNRGVGGQSFSAVLLHVL